MDETKPLLTPSRFVSLSRLPVPKVGVQSRDNIYSVLARRSSFNVVKKTSPRNHTSLYSQKSRGESAILHYFQPGESHRIEGFLNMGNRCQLWWASDRRSAAPLHLDS